MSLILTVMVAMLVISAVLWALTRLYLAFDARAAHWSALWATALVLSALVPVLGLGAQYLTDVDLLPQPDLLSHALPILSFAGPIIEPASEAAPQSVLSWGFVAKAVIWLYLAGAALRAVTVLMGRWQLARIVRSASHYGEADGIEVLLSASVHSAFAWTPLARPGQARIILPRLYVRNMSEAQLADIIRHEREHIARRDDEMGLILRLLMSLCWISPFARSLFAHWAQAIELQCDMAVTDGLSPRMRKAYAETLLEALHIVAGRVRQYPAASFSTPNPRKQRLRNEKMRITNIMTGTRPAFKRGRDRLMLSGIAACVTLAGTLGVAVTAQADMPTAKATNTVTSAIVTGRLTAPFGKTFDPFKDGQTRTHWGVDIAAPMGTPIYAPAAATVVAATDLYDGKPAYGNVVVLQTSDGVTTLFSHLDGYTVRAGQQVLKGEQIATVGSSGKSTGPHVHIETYRGDTRVDPMTVWDLSVD